jgi:hypothetical protein
MFLINGSKGRKIKKLQQKHLQGKPSKGEKTDNGKKPTQESIPP